MRNKKPLNVQANELSNETKVSMKTRIISAAVGLIITVPLVFLGDYFFLALAIFLLAVSIFEIIRCAKKKYSIWLYIVTFGFAAVIAFWPILFSLFKSLTADTHIFDKTIFQIVPIEDWRLFSEIGQLMVPVTAIIVGAMLLFMLVVIDRSYEVRDACFIFTMTIVISLGIQSLLILRYLPLFDRYILDGQTPTSYFNWYDNFESATLIIFVVVGTFMSDAGAYFVGVFFGKHKMNERISPKKTWEGFIGGILFSAITSFVLAFVLALCQHPIVSFLDINHWYLILILSLIIPPVSVLGDFVFSSIKRYYGIKDFGNILPGHGGILDRLDSITFTTMVSALMLTLFVYWM